MTEIVATLPVAPDLSRFSPETYRKFEEYGFNAHKLAANAVRVEGIGKSAIGKTFSVGSKANYVKGVISGVKFGYYKWAGRSLKSIWTITLTAGVNNTVHTFHVAELPR